MKKGVLVGLIVFLMFMMICTVVAKGIYKSGLPRVTVGAIEERSIIYKFSAMGSVQPGQEQGIYTVPGLRVSKIYVQAGDNANADDVLFEVDLLDLADQIRETEAECAYLEAQWKDMAAENKEQEKDRTLAAARLQEDYDNLVREYDLRIQSCQLAADQAWLQLAEMTAVAMPSVSGSDASQSEFEVNLRRVDYEKAQNAVEEAKLQKEEALKDWERELEDAREKTPTLFAQSVMIQNSLDQARHRLGQLKALEEQQGEIRADKDGMMIRGTFLQVGERTTDRACLLYATADGQGVLEVMGGEQETAKLTIGDFVDLKCKYGSSWKPLVGWDFAISYIEKNGAYNTIRIAIPEEAKLLSGQMVQVEAQTKSESYRQVVPLNMLHNDGHEDYVYIVEQSEGILGVEDRIRKIPVLVQEQNETYAAVQSGALTEQSMIVASSNKELHEGDVVRVLD